MQLCELLDMPLDGSISGEKATLWQGGVRNNGIMCSKTMLPRGSPKRYSGGLVHLMVKLNTHPHSVFQM